jgi:hypothetical protein
MLYFLTLSLLLSSLLHKYKFHGVIVVKFLNHFSLCYHFVLLFLHYHFLLSFTYMLSFCYNFCFYFFYVIILLSFFVPFLGFIPLLFYFPENVSKLKSAPLSIRHSLQPYLAPRARFSSSSIQAAATLPDNPDNPSS